jgi:hypothetical protein
VAGYDDPLVETRQRTILGGIGGLLVGAALAWPLLVPNSATSVKVGPLIGFVVLGIALMVAAFRRRPTPEEGRLELFIAARKLAVEESGGAATPGTGQPGSEDGSDQRFNAPREHPDL